LQESSEATYGKAYLFARASKPKPKPTPAPAPAPVKPPPTQPKPPANPQSKPSPASATPSKPPPSATLEPKVAPKPYKPDPVPTNGYGICDVEGYTCLSDDLPLATRSILSRRQDAETINLFKRSSTRDPFTVKLPGKDLVLKSKSYYTSGELFDKAKNGGAKIKEAWVDFTLDAVDNYKVSLFGQKPQQPKKPLPEHDYITEHIVEVSAEKSCFCHA
jgi:hypothetical protein